ncbi:MAG: asparagine synthase C-terminal domain-containing protein [Clostridia bacterium]
MLVYFNFWSIRSRRNILRAKSYINENMFVSLNDKKIKKLLSPKTLEDLTYNEFTATQLTHILRFDDRMYMKHSKESRVQFVDYKFVELASKINPKFKIKNGFTKSILRNLYDNEMPKENNIVLK